MLLIRNTMRLFITIVMVYSSLSFEYKKYTPDFSTEREWNNIDEQEDKVEFINQKKEDFREFTNLNKINKLNINTGFSKAKKELEERIISADNINDNINNNINDNFKKYVEFQPIKEHIREINIKKWFFLYGCVFYGYYFM